MTRQMKVRVTVTVEIDPEAWADTYGCEPSEVREDVQRWAANVLHQQLQTVGVGR